MKADRYKGKPLLRLLECYVLWSIGALSADDEGRLQEMTPKLQRVYGLAGSWQDVVSAAVGLRLDMPESVRRCWEKNQRLAVEGHVVLDPQQFAEMFVDANLVGN